MSSAGKPTTRLSRPGDTWEYHVMAYDVSGFIGPHISVDVMYQALNKYGDEGWELVNTVDII